MIPVIKVHRIEIIAVDTEGEDISVLLDDLKNSGIRALSHQTLEVPYEQFDSHPLNKTATTVDEIRAHFTIPADGNVYVDRPMIPETELEKKNAELRIENERLRAAMRLINAESGRVLGK